MARLWLHRSTPITLAEASGLPSGARVDNGPHGGRVELELPEEALAWVQAAYQLGQAVPEGKLELEQAAALAVAPAAPDADAPAAAPPTTPWGLLDAGQEAAALAAFAAEGLDPDGRERVRVLFQSTDPSHVALACRIATAANWRSFVTPLRRVLDHGDVRVRAEAVRAIGVLAGPALSWQIERLIQDPSPEVRRAVIEALAAIEGRGSGR
jgi:hypothetical protein